LAPAARRESRLSAVIVAAGPIVDIVALLGLLGALVYV